MSDGDVMGTMTPQEIREQITHLESLLPHIEDHHELDGTVEVIGRLKGKLELAIEESQHDQG